METQAMALAAARERGYVAVERFTEWKGHDVYECLLTTDGGEAPDVGLPEFVIANEAGARFTSPDEAFEIIDTLPEE